MKWMRIFTVIAAMVGAALLLAACGGDDDDDTGGEATRTAAPTTAGGGGEAVELELTAENTQFDKDTLEVPAGAEVSLTLDNKDTVQHSFALLESEGSEDELFEGQRFAGPSSLTYEFTAPTDPGTYHFQCDVHPAAMQGDFVVQ